MAGNSSKMAGNSSKIHAPAGPLGHFKSAVPAHPIPENCIFYGILGVFLFIFNKRAVLLVKIRQIIEILAKNSRERSFFGNF
jgi:hypothetical protein